jgi:hypothetical protein
MFADGYFPTGLRQLHAERFSAKSAETFKMDTHRRPSQRKRRVTHGIHQSPWAAAVNVSTQWLAREQIGERYRLATGVNLNVMAGKRLKQPLEDRNLSRGAKLMHL